MKAVVAAFNQEKALVGAFSVITNLRMELFEALVSTSFPWGPAAAAAGHIRSLCRAPYRVPATLRSDAIPNISREKSSQHIFVFI